MSTTISQIIEVRQNGRWEYVPLADVVADENDCLVKYGSVRDMFAHNWYDAEKFKHGGVPDDISKQAREAMIYDTEDFVESGSCWIDLSQYEALSENLHQRLVTTIERLVSCRTETLVSKRLDRLEKMVSEIAGKKISDPCEDGSENEEYVREELEDYMFAWNSADANIAEIYAYACRFAGDEPRYADVRVIMYVS